MTSQQIFTIVFQLVLTGGIGIISYFLKRTTKEDFYREQLKTEQKLDKIMDILMEMKGEK